MHPQQLLRKKASWPTSSRRTDRTTRSTKSYLKTRIRGSRLLNAARFLAFIELTKRLHQAYRFAYDKQAADWLLLQTPVMVSITPEQFYGLVRKRLNYGDCKDFVAKLISKAAELSAGKNDAITTDVMKLFNTINNQTKGGGYRLNASSKDIPSYLPPISGGSGLSWGNVLSGNGVAMVFQKGYYSDRSLGQVERIRARYALTGIHETVHLAGSRGLYLEELLDESAKVVDPQSTSFGNGLMSHCLPRKFR